MDLGRVVVINVSYSDAVYAYHIVIYKIDSNIIIQNGGGIYSIKDASGCPIILLSRSAD